MKNNQKQKKWEEFRKDLEKTIKKYPNLAMDCVDSAYLYGLERMFKAANKKIK